jgi:hypothetical protein
MAPSRTVIAHYALNGQMRSKAHRSDCAVGFTSYKDLQMRYEENHYQWPNAEKTFFDCHLSFFTGKSHYQCCARL